MSRSSGPGAHPAGHPQQPQQRPQAAAPSWPQPQQQQDPQAWPPQQAANGWPAPQGHYTQQGYQQPAHQPQPYQPQGQAAADPLSRGGEYHYPQAQPLPQAAPAADPYAQQRAAVAQQPRTAPPAAQPQYAPQFDAYVPTTRPTAPPAPQPVYQQAPAAQQAYAPAAAPVSQPQMRQAHPLQQALQAGTAAGQLRGSTQEHWPTTAAPQPQAYQPPPAPAYQPAPTEQHGYDLGHYSPAGHHQPQQAPEPTLTRAYAHQGPQQDWSQRADAGHNQAGYGHETNGHGYAQPEAAQPSLDPSGYHNDQQGGYETGQELSAGQDYDQDEEYEEEEPKRRSKGLIIVAALVGAIGLGGGLAYAYKTLLAPSGDKGKVPVVKNDKAPNKVAPVTPGGKQFANSDAKVLNGDAGNKLPGRVGEGGGPAASGSTDPDGVKRVSTVTVGRDGTMSPPVQPAPPPPAPVASPLPGMILSDGGLGPRPLPPPQAQPQQPPQQVAAAPQQPKIIVATPSPPPAPAVTRVPAPPAQAVVSAQQAAAAQSVSAPKKQAVPATKVGATSPGVGTGHVAVLSLLRSEADAGKVFAGLRQKYPDILQARQAGVQEATHPEKGVIHRLLAAPAGAKEEADALCMQLKASGHTGCWVTLVK